MSYLLMLSLFLSVIYLSIFLVQHVILVILDIIGHHLQLKLPKHLVLDPVQVHVQDVCHNVMLVQVILLVLLVFQDIS